MEKKIRFQYLFEKMADDLESLVLRGQINLTPPPTEKIIACPFCLRCFTLQALKNDVILPEHVPARAMGGKVQTLTCADCNHRHGARFEGALVERLRYEELGTLVPGSRAESIFIYDGNEINTHVTFLGEKNFRFNFDPAKSHPRHTEIIQDMLSQENLPDITFVPKKKFNERNSELGVLRTAYLKLFVEFGYKFLINENLEIVRKQLKDPEVNLLSDCGIVDKHVPNELPRLGLVLEPMHLQSYFVCVELKSKSGTEFRFGVLLPLPKIDGVDIYTYSAEYNSSGNWPELTIKPLKSSVT